MNDNLIREEKGSVEVEATFILPIAVLSVVMLLYLSLFMFQKANLQAALETVIVYYKNAVTDTYVTRNTDMTYTKSDASQIGAGNSYRATQALNPYSGTFGDGKNNNDQSAFKKYFDSVAGNMLFDDDLTVKIYYNNGVITDQFEAVAVQKVKFPMDLSLIGVGDSYEISATARVAVVNNDEVIRDVDYAIDIIRGTKIADYADKFSEKVKEVYGKIKSTLGVE